jgi:hypothetical protein
MTAVQAKKSGTFPEKESRGEIGRRHASSVRMKTEAFAVTAPRENGKTIAIHLCPRLLPRCRTGLNQGAVAVA